MLLIVRVIEVTPLVSFQSERSGETIQKVDVLLGIGRNRILATAFDKLALYLSSAALDKSYFYTAELSFSVNGTERKFQSVRLNDLSAM